MITVYTRVVHVVLPLAASPRGAGDPSHVASGLGNDIDPAKTPDRSGVTQTVRHIAACVISLLQPPCEQRSNKWNSEHRKDRKNIGSKRNRTPVSRLLALQAEHTNNWTIQPDYS